MLTAAVGQIGQRGTLNVEAALAERKNTAIAIVGLSCRLPGAADPRAFWDLLSTGTSAVAPVPPGRWAGRDGHGGFLDRLDLFDPEFFGISPREAAVLDPQQRLVLELGWEALEDARIVPGTLRGARAGVFTGAMQDDYAGLAHQSGADVTHHTLAGLNRGMIANRLSALLGLRGPSLNVDSGQSSSLVAVHLACQSLRRGESALALAGGVQLNILASSTAAEAKFGALSPDGRCFTFDARANGYVRGEGGALVVLKRLADAVADGDRVHAVILGGAVNSGTGDAPTVPDARAQAEVLRLACRDAGVEPSGVRFVELHGTGTRVGDPVEAAALDEVYGGGDPLPVGSVKTNIGHLEGAAGAAGLLKAVLAVAHREFPPSLNFETPNPRLPGSVRVVTEPLAFPGDVPVTAGVSSFGMGGANCHLILSSPPPASPAPAARDGAPLPWVLSGRSPAALRAQADALGAFVRARADTALDDIGFSLATTRSAFEYRAAVQAADRDGFLTGLDALSRGEAAAGVVLGEARPGGLAFVFPGQGAQRPGMGRELRARFPVFAEALDEVCGHLDASLGRPLRELMADAPAAELDQTGHAQPALFALGVALSRLFESWGVVPDLVAGHSIGELTAAHVAGVLSLPDACALVAARAALMQALPPGGGMAALSATEAEALELIAEVPGAELAAVNGPASVVVTGDEDAVAELAARWTRSGGKARGLKVSHAFHSARIDPMLAEFTRVAEGLEFRPPRVPIVSNLTGRLAGPDDLCAPEYWARHARMPVRFADGLAALRDEGAGRFLELGPGGVLTGLVRSCLDDGAVAVPALRDGRSEPDAVLAALVRLHVSGTVLDWDALYGGARRVDLPTYAFQRGSHWLGGGGVRLDGGQTAEGTDEAAESGGETAGSGGEAAEGGGEAVEWSADGALHLVRTRTAAVLGTSPGALDTGRAFKELGFDSLMTVELRDDLRAATGLPLATTLLYDHPTPEAVARRLTVIASAGEDEPHPEASRRGEDEPVAIVAMGCRLPGGVAAPDDLWRLVLAETDAVSPFPDDRGWDTSVLRESSAVQAGGFLPDAADFDASLFGISPREAAALDPQQRLLLETSWETLERARIAPTSLRGSRTGVFVGGAAQDYGPRLHEAGGEASGHLLTGTSASVLSGRVAYTFGLEGPAVTVDTACSASLVALHLAVQSLRRDECALALAGGVTVMATPGMFTEFSRQGGLAPDGRCKPFAAAADGTAWAEGVGVVLLERLSDARRHGHPVLALVRGSAINQDGASNGLTAPNGPAQERVIRRALADAGLAAADVDAVEAHGTGTTLGDPIEAGALLATYGQGRPAGDPVRLGSLKSNIGHTQAAAGIAGVIKMVLAMRHGTLPRSLHIDAPTPHVDWSAGAVRPLTEAEPWPERDRPRRAAVSSFGISGTNGHVILEQAGHDPAPGPAVGTGGLTPWPLSARTADALRGQARRLADLLDQRPGLDPADVGHSLATTRAVLDHRAVIVPDGPDGHRDALLRLAADEPGTVQGVAGPSRRVAFLFTGQGSQYAGMGRELYAAYPDFAEALDEACAHLDPLLGRPLRDLMFAEDDPALDETAFTQPALFALQVALFRLVGSFDVRPAMVAGHSVGELTAAHLSGVLSLPDACALVAARGRLMQSVPATGAMLAVRASEERVIPLLDGHADDVALAAVNGPEAVVLSGAAPAVAEIEAECARQGLRTRSLNVSHAFHSPHMDPVVDEFREVAEGLRFAPPRIPIVSAVSGRTATAEEAGDPAAWARHIRVPVRFHDVLTHMAGEGVDAFLELGPDAVLTAMVRDGLVDSPPVCAGVLRKGRAEPAAFLTALARLHVQGVAVDWTAATAGRDPRRIDLPTYAFQRRRHWLAAPASAAAGAGLEPTGHPLLSAVLPEAGGQGMTFTGVLSPGVPAWLADHTILGRTLFPGTAFLEFALLAGARTGCPTVEELTLEAPLALPAGESVQVQVVVGAEDDGGRRVVRLYGRPPGGSWTRHASGVLAPEAEPSGAADRPSGEAETVDLTGLYDRLAADGYDYGPSFQRLGGLRRLGDELHAEIDPADDLDLDGHLLHPALLDAALHPVVGPFGMLAHEGTALPFAWRGVTLHASGAGALRVRITPGGPDTVSLTVADAGGAPVLTVDGLTLRPSPRSLPAADGGGGDLLRVNWTPVPLPDRPAAESETVMVEAGGGGEPAAVHDAVELSLRAVRDAASGEDGARLVLATRGAVATEDGADITDLAGAAVWGLARSAQAELPGRIVLVDHDGHPASREALPRALASGEPQLALREGRVLVPRLGRAAPDTLTPPPGGSWRLDVTAPGSLDALALLPAPDVPLGPGTVRVALRAGGLNFRDVLIALGVYPGGARLGAEGAGVVVETSPDVPDLAPGDRVMGLFPGTLGPSAVTDRRLLAPIPDGWTFAQAAATPIVFLTAHHGLSGLAGLRAGERLLVHAATGGVGMAAVQLARRLGAHVYATASPGKWDVLRAMGVPDERLASSRDLEFERRFGGGVDVVLHSLAGEFTDATLRLAAPGGRVVELGKTDVRDPARVAADHPGVSYQAFDLLDLDPDVIARAFAELLPLFAAGTLRPLPVRARDVRRAPGALRTMSQARHTGKLVLTLPTPLDPDGVVLVTGGTGTLGGLTARHLVERHGVRRLLLTGRRGRAAPGAAELAAGLEALGAEVTVAACDAADERALASLLDGLDRPLTGVFHAAGVIDDGVLDALDPERIARVLRPKVDAAWNLHRLTEHLDLAEFVLFSSAVGVLGNAGQANYAAANAFLDALAVHRRARGLPARALAWGSWREPSGITAGLTRADHARLARAGLAPLDTGAALGLLDAALADAGPAVVPARIAPEAAGHPLLGDLLRGPARGTAAGRRPPGVSRDDLAALEPAERERRVLALVRGIGAAVLGHADPESIVPDRGFLDAEFDSLSVVELRSRLAEATGLRLPATLTFDHPTPAAVAAHLAARLGPSAKAAEGSPLDALARLEAALAADAAARPRIVARLRELLAHVEAADGDGPDLAERLSAASHDEIFDFIDNELSTP
ncbi:SDR family NAD(P)-dependent oxidoreductase [Actinomadura sp. 9N215]|uniref:SDR family NAD(P)-dependent oxidoreductase n=1 Tax=Actinomadura sp. 9N215 TaxID=3375150 RepID=UPI00379BFD29